ncbi:hypothetical protein LguiA_014270 [Lonicera macranthoides]
METSLHQYKSTPFTHNSTLRDASFSSYLIPPPQPSPIRGSELSIFDAQKYFNETTNITTNLDPKERTSVSATTIEERARLSSVSSVTDGYSRNYRVRSFHATPTASSEASWNSQTGLLSNPPGSIPVSLKNIIPSDIRDRDQRGRKGGFVGTKWFFRPKCPCSGRKSVQVREKKVAEPNSNINNHRNTVLESSKMNSITISEERKEKVLPKSHLTTASSYVAPCKVEKNINQHRTLETVSSTPSVQSRGTGDGFSFPILKRMNLPQTPLEDPPRDSLEVFQPSDEPISNKSNVREGRAYGFGFAGSPISRTDDDVASDASSDLFEIESFSTQTTSYPMYLRRDSLDEATTFNNARRLVTMSTGGNFINCHRSMEEPATPSVAPTECYEPSEASIDWSVTTAEGFDRASVTNYSSVSAFEWDNGGGGNHHHHGGCSGGGGGGGGGGGEGIEGGRIRKGKCGLLSCRHEKAVSVGPNPVKCVLEEQQYGAFPLISSTIRHVSGRVPNTKMPFINATSHSARLSLPFAAQV